MSGLTIAWRRGTADPFTSMCASTGDFKESEQPRGARSGSYDNANMEECGRVQGETGCSALEGLGRMTLPVLVHTQALVLCVITNLQ